MTNTISLAELDQYFLTISEQQFDKRFVDRCVIGKGAGSIICKAIDTQMQNKQIALKMYNKVQMREQNRIDVARQVQILTHLKANEGSKYIVEIYQAYKIKKSFGSEYCLALELCQQSLYDYIRKQEYLQVPYLEKVKICLKISQGIQFMHQNSIIHRDVKPGNILIKVKNGELAYLIADFGQSKVFQFGVQNSILRGTPIYSNPHALQETNYSFEPDIFSLALSMIQILTNGKSLFNTGSIRGEYKLRQQMKKQLADVGMTLNNVPQLPKQMKYILTRCLSQTKIKVEEVCQSLCDIISVMEIEQKYKELEKMEVTEFPKAFSKKQHDKIYQLENKGQQTISVKEPEENMMKIYHIDSEENKSSKQAEFSKRPDTVEHERVDKQGEKKYERLSTKGSDENISKIDSIHIEAVNNRQETGRKMKKVESWFDAFEKDQTSLQISKSDIHGHSESNPPQIPKSVSSGHICIQFQQNTAQISSDLSCFAHQVEVSWLHRKSNTKPVVNGNKMLFAKKLLCMQQGIKQRCDYISQSIALMQNLTKYKQKFVKMKQIQHSNLQENEKNKLMLIYLKQLIKQLNNECKQLSNPNSKKHYEKYMNNLKVHYQKIYQNFMTYYSRTQLTEVIEFLKKDNNNQQQTTRHYNSLIRKDSKLSRALDAK